MISRQSLAQTNNGNPRAICERNLLKLTIKAPGRRNDGMNMCLLSGVLMNLSKQPEVFCRKSSSLKFHKIHRKCTKNEVSLKDCQSRT